MNQQIEKKKFSDAMTNSILKLRKEFRHFHAEKENQNGMIRYGRAGSLSHFFERTIAEELSPIFPTLYFFVDYPISLYDEDSKFQKTLHHDIMVVKKLNASEELNEGEIVGIIDLKIDLGYIDDEYYGIPSDWKKNSNVQIMDDYGFKQREAKFNSAAKIKCNKIVNPNYDNIKNNVGERKIILQRAPQIMKLAIISTKTNDHGRATLFKASMDKNEYLTFYLLKNAHPNQNSDDDFSKIIEKDMQDERERMDVHCNFEPKINATRI